ncbi:hypothetical protein D3C72_2148030 [compost metagenome]
MYSEANDAKNKKLYITYTYYFTAITKNTHKEAFQGLVQLKPYKLPLHFSHTFKKMKALSQNLFSDPVKPTIHLCKWALQGVVAQIDAA